MLLIRKLHWPLVALRCFSMMDHYADRHYEMTYLHSSSIRGGCRTLQMHRVPWKLERLRNSLSNIYDGNSMTCAARYLEVYSVVWSM